MQCNNEEHVNEIKFVCDHLPSWTNVPVDKITIEKFPFGHSRLTFKVTAAVPDLTPNPVLLKKFVHPDPQEFELFQKLSDIGWGPKLFYVEGNLRIEQYFDSTVITWKQLSAPSVMHALVVKLGQLHSIEGLLKTEKKGFLIKLLEGSVTMQACKKNLDLDIYTDEEKITVQEIKEAVSEKEVEFLKTVVSDYPLITGHNDIWVGNILLLKNKQDTVLVDYEMMDYNFPGYDVGKLILEPLYERHASNPSYKFRGIENLMTEEEIKECAKYYLIGKHGIQMQTNKSLEELLKTHYGTDEAVQEAVLKMYREIQVGMLMSGYYSMTLGMRVGKNSGFQLDFFQFAKDGLITYKEFKKRLFQ